MVKGPVLIEALVAVVLNVVVAIRPSDAFFISQASSMYLLNQKHRPTTMWWADFATGSVD